MNHNKLIYLTLTITTLTTINTITLQNPTQANQPQNNQTTTQIKASDWYYQGIIKAHQKDYRSAIDNFTKAIEINPRYIAAYYQIGLIYANYARNKILRPDGTLPGCIRVNQYSISCDVKVTANWKQENREQAIKDLNRVISIAPEFAAAYYQRGLIQEKRQDKLKDLKIAALTYLKFDNYSEAANVLEDIDKLYLEDNSEELEIESPTGSPGQLSEMKKSFYQLMKEGRQALRKGDKKTALRKYKLAARKLKKGTQMYRDLQRIIKGIEGKVKK
ncbi:MAG: tetratricopeptide repeat protein [Rivularia sp. ALOHA_DT_140]|nr:tetratricopeptide repeat protein [Rivularia sp. ALOHA_DT_140]